MPINKNSVLLLTVLFIGNIAVCQESSNIKKQMIYGKEVLQVNMPNIQEYVTLFGDFHMHTIYSDGAVLSEVRVNEIYREGLNVLAITDHAESSPLIKELPKDSNKSNILGKQRAEQLGIVFAPGTEITRDFRGDDFSAHFVCLFMEDVNKIEGLPTIEMLREAKNQGAFIFWAHPWKAGKDIWDNEIKEIIAEKLIDGVEILNSSWFSKETAIWGLRNNLALFGNTDSHDPIFYGRPRTIVFSKEKNVLSLKEALFDRRTVVLNGPTLYGKEKYLSPMFYASIINKTPNITLKEGVAGRLIITNKTDINYRIIIDKTSLPIDLRKEIILEANKDTTINITNKSLKKGTNDIVLRFANANMVCEDGNQPVMTMRLSITLQ